MPEGVINRLPNLTGVRQTSASAESGVSGLLAALSASGTAQSSSPLGAVFTAFQGVDQRVSVDAGGLTTRFPAALETMRNALPADSLAFARSLEPAFDQARGFLQNSRLAAAVQPGHSLQETALALVGDLLQGFDQKRQELTDNLIDPAALQVVVSALDSFNRFATDFAAHRDDFLPFLTRHVLGVAPDILSAPLGHLDSIRAVISPLQTSSVDAALGPAWQAMSEAIRGLANTLTTFDPADPSGYEQIDNLLEAIETACRNLSAAAAPLYQQAQALVDNHAWDAIFSRLRDLLRAVDFAPSLSIDEVISGIAAVMDALLSRLQTFVGPQDLIPRIEALNRTIHDLLADSPLGQIRRSLREFLETIRHAIESVPTEQIQQTIEDLLGRVKQEIDQLGLDSIAQTIELAFRDLEHFINEQIDEALRDEVGSAVRSLVGNLNGLPIDTLASNIENVIDQAQSLIAELEVALQEGVGQLSQAAERLEELSFKPVGDEVIGEINDLKTRLRAINPNALSDVEKLAIKGALAALQAIDLEGFITTKVKNGFNAAKDGAKSALDEVTMLLNRLRDRVEEFQPRQLVAALKGLLDQAQRSADGLSARSLCQPLYRQIDAFAQRLQAISPGALLDPLRQPYQTVLAAVDEINPDRLIAPLNSLYAQVNGLIDRVDVTPLLDELDRRQKALLDDARAALLSALDGLSLPEPLAGFLNALRPVLEAITGAIFQDSDAQMIQLSDSMRLQLDLTKLFTPLDRAFDELMRMLATVPGAELEHALETIRTTIVAALDALDPRRIVEMLRTGERLLADLSPTQLFAAPSGAPSLKLVFEAHLTPGAPANAAATLARFDAVIQLTSPAGSQSLLAPLADAHGRLTAALRARVNALDPGAAETAYGALREKLERVVPGFLRGAAALTPAEILGGFESLRPSRKAAELDQILNRFLQQLEPMQAALEPAMKAFFGSIREAFDLLNPLSLKDAVADIYTAIRQKVRTLDPEQLAASLHAGIYDPLAPALQAIDPAALKARLDHVFQSALRAIKENIKAILDEIVAVLDEQLQALRDALKAVVDKIEASIERAAQTFQGIVDSIERPVFVEILERLRRVIDSLGVSFEQELGRVRSAFDEMLNAIPLSGGASASAPV